MTDGPGPLPDLSWVEFDPPLRRDRLAEHLDADERWAPSPFMEPRGGSLLVTAATAVVSVVLLVAVALAVVWVAQALGRS